MFSGPVRPTPGAVSPARPAGLARIDGGFWAERRRVNAEVSLAEGPERLEAAGNLANFRAAALARTGGGAVPPDFAGDFPFQDSDVYKWLEAACWQMADTSDGDPSDGHTPDGHDGHDGRLAAAVDAVVDVIAAAQREDGYLQTYYQLGGREPWTEPRWGHELYCAGHLIQAAVAHHRATGSGRLLAVARRFADHIDSVFGPGKHVDTVCGHPEAETALIELYRTTSERRYLELARYFLDRRGHGSLSAGADRGHGHDPGPEYWQDHTPVRAADEVTGHAVRQLYLLAGAADCAAETGDPGLRAAAERLWRDMVTTKTYLTGGVGSRHDGEAFGDAYELPADRAYTETCAAIASVHFSWRMALLTGEARYSDLVERTLFNGFLAGAGLDGRTWLYVNPLHRRARPHQRPGDQSAHRTPWFRCACCPPNVMRLLAALPHYAATTGGDGLYLHQYATGVFGSDGLTVRVTTDYPWDGTVTVNVEAAPERPRALALRLPAWCPRYTLALNGTALDGAPESGWLRVTRAFAPGDTVRLDLAMEPRLTVAGPRVDAARGCAAIERGPLVYCLEQTDQPGGLDPDDFALDPDAPLTVERRPDLLGGVSTVSAVGRRRAEEEEPDGDGFAADWPYRPLGAGERPLGAGEPPYGAGERPYGERPYGERPYVTTRTSGERVRVTAVPYYAWANRDAGAMRVWLPLTGQGSLTATGRSHGAGALHTGEPGGEQRLQ
ncbi:beta-L-arabinofuranosidase domain-containing protein [Streptomyces sp. NPDC093085]|uniref:glycoside hydrolase family 127 protein n=1 Tax=Streptomyces sp. NPDC093085 TaxID=3155068 RepID=UPI0034338C16